MQTVSSPGTLINTDDSYHQAIAGLVENMSNVLADAREQLFYAVVEGDLFKAYLNAYPTEQQQHYNCGTCKNFIRQYGHVVTIDDRGELTAAFWNPDAVPEPFKAVVRQMAVAVTKSGQVADAVFIEADTRGNSVFAGVPATGDWKHFHFVLPAKGHRPFAGVSQATFHEEHNLLARSTADLSIETINKTITLIELEALYSGEKHLAALKWLLALQTARKSLKGNARKNIVWRFLANSGHHWAHIMNTVIGEFMKSLEKGLDVDEAERRYNNTIDPRYYQRPQAAPSDGAIDVANKIISTLGMERSVLRRHADLSDLKAVWTPTPVVKSVVEQSSGGVFDHLRENAKPALSDNPGMGGPISWRKFKEKILPKVDRLFYIPTSGAAQFTGFITAVDYDAPPIMRWDTAEERYPVSAYVYSALTPASRWGLTPGDETEIKAIVVDPACHAKPEESQWVAFILEGAQDTGLGSSGLFPECIIHELRECRSAIEAFSKSAPAAPNTLEPAAGVRFDSGRNSVTVPIQIGVEMNGIKVLYVLNNWE